LTLLWHKVRADLENHKSRTFLAIVNIAIGVASIGILLGMIDLQLTKMDRAHFNSHPSHISLILRRQADSALLKKIEAMPAVAGIDVMNLANIRYRANDQVWRDAVVVLRPKPARQRYDKTGTVIGLWPERQQLAIENLSADVAGLTLGDKVEIDTGREMQSFHISGIVRHPFVKPPKFGGQVHFFSDLSNADLFGIPADTFRQILVTVAPPYNPDKVRQIATDIRSLLAAQKSVVNVTFLQDPEKHWGQPFLAGIHFILKGMAAAALLLAGALIFNTVSAQMIEQTYQIGILKAIGASRWIIACHYLTETFLMAFAASIIALPVSVIVAYFSSCQLLQLFNIDCGRFDFSPRSIVVMLIGGIATPILAALVPVLRGSFMTVHAALSSRGGGSIDFGRNRFDRALERFTFTWLSTLQAAALGNLFRRKWRLALTQSTLLTAGCVFLILMSLMASVNLTLDNEMARTGFTLRIGFGREESRQKIRDIVNASADTKTVEFWQRLPIELFRDRQLMRQQGSLGVQLLAMPVASRMYRPYIEAGRWFLPEDSGRHALVISADMARLNGVATGDRVQAMINNVTSDWEIIGIYRWLAGSSFAVEPVYAPLETIETLLPVNDTAAFVLIDAAVATPDQEQAYVSQLKNAFGKADITWDVYTTVAKQEQRNYARAQFKPILATLFGLATMIAVIGAIGLSGTLSLNVMQRLREIGILRAIGAPSKNIFRLFQLEGLLHGLLGWLLAVPLAFMLARPIAGKLGRLILGIDLDFTFHWPAVLYWFLTVMSMAWVASYWPARRASNLTVNESLGH
jgi:putative ABC transport system permease protein